MKPSISRMSGFVSGLVSGTCPVRVWVSVWVRVWVSARVRVWFRDRVRVRFVSGSCLGRVWVRVRFVSCLGSSGSCLVRVRFASGFASGSVSGSCLVGGWFLFGLCLVGDRIRIRDGFIMYRVALYTSHSVYLWKPGFKLVCMKKSI